MLKFKWPEGSLWERIERAEAEQLEHAPPRWFFWVAAVAIVVIGVGFLVRGEPVGAALILIGGGWVFFARNLRREREQRR